MMALVTVRLLARWLVSITAMIDMRMSYVCICVFAYVRICELDTDVHVMACGHRSSGYVMCGGMTLDVQSVVWIIYGDACA